MLLFAAGCHAQAPVERGRLAVVAVPPASTADGPNRATRPVAAEPLNAFSSAHAGATLLEVRRMDTKAGGEQATLALFVRLARPDLGLDEPDNSEGRRLTVDLPLPLQPKLFYLSAPDDTQAERGSMCDRPRFPHECGLGQLRAEDAGRSELSLLLKLTFEDGRYEALPITVPVPAALPLPEWLAPTTLPAQGSGLAFAFRDLDADAYTIGVHACDHYANNGINPCLDSTHVTLTRTPTGFDVTPGTTHHRVDVAPRGHEIHVRVDVPLQFAESISYEIVATKYGRMRGVKTRTQSTASRSFQR